MANIGQKERVHASHLALFLIPKIFSVLKSV